MRISRIFSCKTVFIDLYAYFVLSRKTQHVARQYIKNRLVYYLMCLNMNYGFFIPLIIQSDHVFISINKMQYLIFKK